MSDPHWLVKDFHVLYRAARGALDAILELDEAAATAPARKLDAALDGLGAQLTRLRPAFEVCEYERRHPGLPPRLTPAERKALAALHRWLHSPLGDDVLTEEAADYHDQLEAAEGPAECERLEKEEAAAYAGLIEAAAYRGAPWRDAEHIVVTVHLLSEGRPLCGIPGPPGRWKRGHRWVSAHDDGEGGRVNANCEACKAELARRDKP